MATVPQVPGHDAQPLPISPWQATATAREFPMLQGDLVPDTCVIGAGIAGLTTAYMLAREGRSVVVLEAGGVAGGMSSATTAHVTCAVDDGIARVAELHGTEGARLSVDSHVTAIRRIASIVRQERIECGFIESPGYLFASPGQDPERLEREFEAALAAGVPGVAMLPEIPGLPFDSGTCLLHPEQAQFHPVRYLNGLAEAIVRLGGHVYCRTHVKEIEESNSLSVVTESGVVRARHVIIATNAPIHPRVAVNARQVPQISHVLGIGIRPGSIPPLLAWDTDTPYHYLRTMQDPRLASVARNARELLLVGGEDHRTGEADDPEDRQAALEDWARTRFGSLLEAVEFAWCGQFFQPHDNVAFMGRVPDREDLFVLTGDTGQGITHATAGALLVSDLIAGRQNPWEELYDPARVTLRAGGVLARQLMGTVGFYADWARRSDVSNADDIAPGCGAVLVRGRHRLATYRDASGGLHVSSAACPHLGGLVHWNSASSTWDCPCHGSRFDPLGRVLSGPARRDLRKLGLDEDPVSPAEPAS